MRLRQIALAATDLAATTAALCDVLGIGAPFRDPGVAVFGLENAVFAIGQTFLEVVSPVRDDATAKRWIAKRGGDAGYMVIVQCDDLATLAREIDRAKSAGAVVVWQGDHAGARTAHFHPRELGAIVSLDGMASWGDWVWAGPQWPERSHVQTTRAITGAEMASRDPEKLAARWTALLGIKARRSNYELAIAFPRGGRIAFVPGDGGDALVGVEIALADRARFEARARTRGVLGGDGAATIAGVRFIPA
jgi:Glyoxalase-like domain